MILPENHQYVNFHAHRHSNSPDEWVLTSVMYEDFPELIAEGNYSLGLHPWSIKKVNVPEALRELKKDLSHPDIIALGEAGLDKAIETPMELQLEVFERQLQMAVELNYPVIVHCVKADAELIALRKKYPELIMIFHGYTGSKEQAMELIRHDFYLSVGTALLRSEKLQKAVFYMPNERLLLETDEADINIHDLYSFTASLKSMNLNRLQEQVSLNCREIFSVL